MINLNNIPSITFHVGSPAVDVTVSLGILDHITAENKIEVIKEFRNENGIGLVEAKEIINTLILLRDNQYRALPKLWTPKAMVMNFSHMKHVKS